jgi:hypothetical protein
VDYVKIESEHELVDTMTADDLNKAYRNGTLPDFEAVVTFSSVEHSGLGR